MCTHSTPVIGYVLILYLVLNPRQLVKMDAAAVSLPAEALLPVLNLALFNLDASSILAAHSVNKQWLRNSQLAVDKAKAKRAERDVIISQMLNLPQMDSYAYYPAAARMHVYRSRGTDLPTAWLILYELVGWTDQDANMGKSYLGDRYTVAQFSPNAPPPAEALDADCYFMCGVGEQGAQSQRDDFFGRLTSIDEGPFADLEEGDHKQDEEYDDEDEEVEPDFMFNLTALHPSRRFVQLRGGSFPISKEAEWYKERGVGENEDVCMNFIGEPAGFGADGISGPGLLRALVMEHREELMGSKAQLQRMLNPEVELVKLFQLDDWYHCDGSKYEYVVKTTPEEAQKHDGRFDHQPRYNPTMLAIAQCIIDGSANHYYELVSLGKLPAGNTHWSNWPNAGFHK